MKFNFLFFFFFFSTLLLNGQDTLFQYVRDAANDTEFQLRKDLDAFLMKEERVKITYLTSPLSLKGHLGIQYILTTLKDYPQVEFDLLYKFKEYPSNLFNPDSNLLEIKVQLAIKVLFPELHRKYLLKRGEKLDENWEIVASQIGADTNVINQVIIGYIDSYVLENYSKSTYLESEYSTMLEIIGENNPFAKVHNYGIDPIEYFFLTIPDPELDPSSLGCCNYLTCVELGLTDKWGGVIAGNYAIGLKALLGKTAFVCAGCGVNIFALTASGFTPSPAWASFPISCGSCINSITRSLFTHDQHFQALGVMAECKDDPCTNQLTKNNYKECPENQFCIRHQVNSTLPNQAVYTYPQCRTCPEISPPDIDENLCINIAIPKWENYYKPFNTNYLYQITGSPANNPTIIGFPNGSVNQSSKCIVNGANIFRRNLNFQIGTTYTIKIEPLGDAIGCPSKTFDFTPKCPKIKEFYCDKSEKEIVIIIDKGVLLGNSHYDLVYTPPGASPILLDDLKGDQEIRFPIMNPGTHNVSMSVYSKSGVVPFEIPECNLNRKITVDACCVKDSSPKLKNQTVECEVNGNGQGSIDVEVEGNISISKWEWSSWSSSRPWTRS